MLDPLTALSIASSVIQIIDFGCKLVSETQQIYHSASGATKDNVTLREITEDIIILDTNLSWQNQNNQRLSPDDIVLGNLADSCAREAKILLGLLEELAVQPDATQWNSFKKAIKSARKKEKVGDIEKRLRKIQGQPLSIACYRYLENEHREPGYALEAVIEPFSIKQLVLVHRDFRNRINFLCKDLLEINGTSTHQRFDYQVDFLHRTVRDFLMEKDMHQDLIQRATENNTTHWDPYQALCLVKLARAKALHLKDKMQERLNVLFSLVDALMFYAHEVEIQQKEPQTGLLDQLDQTISTYADENKMVYHWTNARDPPTGSHFDERNDNSFLALTIQSRLSLYVKDKLHKTPGLLRAKKGRPLLDYALRPNIVTPTRLPQFVEFVDFDMVCLLLDEGAKPNEKVSIYGNITVWALFLLSCYEKKDIQNAQAKETWFKVAELMIRKGADRKLRLETTRRGTAAMQAAKPMKMAKYRTLVTPTEVLEPDFTVELTAAGILREIFGDGKIAEIEAIEPEVTSWSVWNWMSGFQPFGSP